LYNLTSFFTACSLRRSIVTGIGRYQRSHYRTLKDADADADAQLSSPKKYIEQYTMSE